MAGGISVVRKVQADAGRSILNLEKKRHAIYTPFFVFCKELQSNNLGTRFTKAVLDDARAHAGDELKESCAGMARKWIENGPYLVSEIPKVLYTARGAVFWSTVASLVAGMGNLEPTN